MATPEELLRRFAPQLRYDSNEQYFADGAAQWTDNPGNELRRADRDGRPGALIASASPTDDTPRLSLDFLAADSYANGEPVRDGDVIGDGRTDYREQYVALRTSRPDLKNRMYGRAVESGGRLWLQYWFWYFYNDYNLALGAGRHEGDWEMIQLRMHGDEPDLAVYAQHHRAEKRPWADVEKLPDNPDTSVVYVARGSHASYFEAGFHDTDAWYDLADGKRKTPVLMLEIVQDTPGWLAWPGRWGDTRAKLGGVHTPSPTAPCTHGQWDDPDDLLKDAWSPVRRAAPRAPDVTLSRAEGKLKIAFDFTAHPQPAPRTLVVTVNSRDELGVPPRTYTLNIADTLSGALVTRIAVDPAKHYDIYTSLTSGDTPVPSASRLTELDPVGPGWRAPFVQRVVRHVGRIFAWLRGHVRR